MKKISVSRKLFVDLHPVTEDLKSNYLEAEIDARKRPPIRSCPMVYFHCSRCGIKVGRDLMGIRLTPGCRALCPICDQIRWAKKRLRTSKEEIKIGKIDGMDVTAPITYNRSMLTEEIDGELWLRTEFPPRPRPPGIVFRLPSRTPGAVEGQTSGDDALPVLRGAGVDDPPGEGSLPVLPGE